jgi:hypothetical protein
MGLRGQFSNLSETVSGLLSHSLTTLDQDQDLSDVATTAGWPDGRRKLGAVSGAILAVLEQHVGEMSTKAIREQVEILLGGSVSRFSVSDYLLTRSKKPSPLFERTRHGHYRLLP